MAKRVEGTLEKVLESAKVEFLTLGFEKASMRNIAKAAGVTTGALYVRFPNKDALFCALVKPVVDEVFSMFHQSGKTGMEYLRSGNISEAYKQSDGYLSALLDYVYNNIEIFRLLINHAGGSSFDGFFETLVEFQVEYSIAYLEERKRFDSSAVVLSKEELHLMVSAEFYAVFEVVRHDVPRDEAVRLINTLVRFFNPGWRDIFGV